jgi:excisionase family DNA binding protein
MDTVMTVREVAQLLRVHQATIYRLLRAKRLPGFRIGYDWRFSRQAVETWIKDNSAPDRS